MTRAYLRLDPGFYERKVIRQKYAPAAAIALVGVYCLAETQTERGRFRDDRLLKALLGDLGRQIHFLIGQGDIVRLPDGRIYVEGWDEWQEGDWKVGERVRRIRTRKNDTPPTVTSVTAPTVAPPSEHSVIDGAGGALHPPTPSRSNGTNPRAIARRLSEARQEESKARKERVESVKQRYYRGQLTEAQRDAELADLAPA